MTSPDTGLGAGITSFPGIARIASRGNRMATLISAFAFAFSGVSFYETVLKRPKPKRMELWAISSPTPKAFRT